MLGLSIGTIVLPPSPSYFRRMLAERSRIDLSAPRQNDKMAIELASYSIVWWAVLGFTRLIGMDEGVSRQTANFPYAMWITAFNTSFILAYVVLDMIFYPAVPIPKTKLTSPPTPASGYFSPAPVPTQPPVRAPPLLEAINKNSLLLFLLANVGTGLVNLSMQTMYAKTATSMGVLTLYALAVCSAAWALRQTRVWRL